MRTVAQLRRELGVGAPRDTNSLYKPIERAPRKFNPLKIPKTLQAQLPFKSKVMNFAGRKRETLEQKRAIKVREPGEKRADALVHALNTIRNAKNQKRREQQTRRREVGLVAQTSLCTDSECAKGISIMHHDVISCTHRFKIGAGVLLYNTTGCCLGPN